MVPEAAAEEDRGQGYRTGDPNGRSYGRESPQITLFPWFRKQLPTTNQARQLTIRARPTADGKAKLENTGKVPIKHTFLIRHPHRVALSMRRMLSNFFEYEGDLEDYDLSSDANYCMAWEKLSPDPVFKLWNHVRENVEPNPVVIDADDLQTHPEQILRKYCEAVGIPFQESYLRWEASDESLKCLHGSLSQTTWGKNMGIYDNAFSSSSFHSLECETPETVPEKCRKYVAEFMGGYKVMYETRIKLE